MKVSSHQAQHSQRLTHTDMVTDLFTDLESQSSSSPSLLSTRHKRVAVWYKKQLPFTKFLIRLLGSLMGAIAIIGPTLLIFVIASLKWRISVATASAFLFSVDVTLVYACQRDRAVWVAKYVTVLMLFVTILEVGKRGLH